ncbi:MAG: (d)CMP kinase, partial [Alphaproteobacteria bacterium]|nr:(d)CMP kinase [Alphaproteobacteria bacterium]
MIIAVDGPAASGKGTIARAIAKARGLAHLDTGLLYRVTGFLVLEGRGDPDDPDTALAAARQAATA